MSKSKDESGWLVTGHWYPVSTGSGSEPRKCGVTTSHSSTTSLSARSLQGSKAKSLTGLGTSKTLDILPKMVDVFTEPFVTEKKLPLSKVDYEW